MHVILSFDSSNITYNLEKRAQARLGRSAPCLGLTLYFDSTDGTVHLIKSILLYKKIYIKKYVKNLILLSISKKNVFWTIAL